MIHTVPETCLKESMPCKSSPLGFHLASTVKEKIWRDEFIDLLSLLPTSKEFLKQEKDKNEEDRRRPVARNFFNWLQAFFIYASILCEKFPERSVGLFHHIDTILEAYKSFRGFR